MFVVHEVAVVVVDVFMAVLVVGAVLPLTMVAVAGCQNCGQYPMAWKTGFPEGGLPLR